MPDSERQKIRIIGTEQIKSDIESSKALSQAKNALKLPGRAGKFHIMPDGHRGYGFPIGSVAAFEKEAGTISPAAIGFDINCGVRMLTTDLDAQDIEGEKNRLANILSSKIPTGLSNAGTIDISSEDLEEILKHGVEWMRDNSYASERDVRRCENSGKMDVDETEIPQEAKEKGVKQIGSLGSGNHFLEVQKVSDIYQDDKAELMGLRRNQVVIMIHCGSRGLGYKTAKHHIQKIEQSQVSQSEQKPEELAYTELSEPSGRAYFESMKASSNYAWANRQAITHEVRNILQTHYGAETKLLYDHSHNIAYEQNLEINGESKSVVVHRKGATKSLPPGSNALPPGLKQSGQPVLLPGDMKSGGYILSGRENSLSFQSAPHGAGRQKSRTQSRKQNTGGRVKKRLENEGVQVRADSSDTIEEEAPGSYKDISEVVRATVDAGLCKKVSRQKPLVNIKG